MQRTYGFTIVELLIVIVVIAILAALSYVGYTSMNNRAHDSVVRQDLATVSRLLELAKVEPTLGRYPRTQSETPTGFKFSKDSYSTAANNAMYCVNHNTDQYALGVTSKSGKRYLLTPGGVQEDVSVTAEGVCGAIETAWTSPPASAPRSAIHGFSPSNGWHSTWSWAS